MKLEFVPLLRVQRELYDIPRGPQRFREYLQKMIDPGTRDLHLPLVALNPMAKDHVPALLDRLLALGIEQTAAVAVGEAAAQLADSPGEFKVTLVLSDDAQGGWTNRITSDFTHRFEDQALRKRGWITALLWSADEPSREAAREEALLCIFRTDHVLRHGPACTLREMLAQEGHALAAASCTLPSLPHDELELVRARLRPHLDSVERPILIACLYGDAAAESLGYTPRGLAAHAGFALARHDAGRGAISA